MKTISARMFLLMGALICLSGCGNILGTGGKSTLYRISSTPVPEREIARQWIPVYITRPTLPPGAMETGSSRSRIAKSRIWPKHGG